ncbi:MAG: glycoside hydrolase family 13 protein [Sphaerochaetaceae bacterium]|nr:glycoside hydrolase family 13 protein [Sphaerochaetaceae bacterium]
MQLLKSGISNLYVRPLYPKSGEEVSLFALADPSRVKWVRLSVIDHDNVSRHGMPKVGQLFGYDLYKASLRMPEGELRYWFEAELFDKSDAYLSRRGASEFLCAWEDAFVLASDLSVPSWTPRTICYQIFPDRFCNGNPSLGAKTGEYEFDGHPTIEMKWDDKPLHYLDGFCLDFFNGDFEGIVSKIDYLKSLGIGAIYLNPIGCSRTTHRYDCTDYLHIDPKLGGDEGYANMVQALHKAGIKVITDISINHTGIDNKWFISAKQGGPEEAYYYKNKKGGFDCWFNVSTLPQLNYGSKELRKIVYEDEDSVVQKFLRPPFCQDGWRFDVATSVGNHGNEHMCHEIWQEVRKRVKAINSQVYIVGEDWEDSTAYLKGDQWDATMNYVGCSRPLRRWMGEPDRYFLNNNTNPGKCQPYSARQLKGHLERQLSSMVGQMVYQQMNLIDSHDAPRLHCNTKVYDRNLYRGVVMMQYLLPGMPCVYYGDEIGIEGPMGTVENCRYPMVWDEKRWDMDFVELYRSLGRLRKDYETALSEGQWEFGYCDDEVLEFRRVSENQKVVLVLYRGESERTVEQIDVSGMTDWFTQSTCESLVLEPRTSRLFVG